MSVVRRLGKRFRKDRVSCPQADPLEASPSKRKRCSTSESVDKRVEAFRRWCCDVGIVLHPKLYIGHRDSCADIGVVALEAIEEGERLAVIPRSALLSCSNSSVHDLVTSDKKLRRQMAKLSSWVPLLIALLGEKGCKTHSNWYHYLSLVPNNEHSGPPMLWGKTERKRLLLGTGVKERVEGDLERIEHDFRTVVLPFMQRHPQTFKKHLHSQQVYEQLVAFVMSYSFTDSGEEDLLQQTMMVPFVDLLNHHSHHHAELSFGEERLELFAVRRIGKGEEVMNTYGPLPNASLVHIYGFAESDNPHDKACVTADVLMEQYLKCSSEKKLKKREKRWEQLVDDEFLEDSFEVSVSGEPEEQLLALVKLLHAKRCEYRGLREQLRQLLSDGSSDGSSDSDLSSAEEPKVDGCLLLDLRHCNLQRNELDFLKKVVEQSLAVFPEDHDSNLATLVSGQPLTSRERSSLLLCIGQQKCLLQLLKQLKSFS